jgi:hypothetical protein
MKGLILLRWLFAKGARDPWAWAIVTILAALWPALQVFAPFGVDEASAEGRTLIYEVAFVGAGAGVAWSLSAFEFLPSCAYALGIRPGWRAEWIVMLSAGVIGTLISLAIPLAAGWSRALSFAAQVAPRTLLSAASFASVGVLVLRVRWLAGSQALALLAVTWMLPAILPSSFISDTLGRSERWTSDVTPSASAFAGRIASICALLLCAHLVDARRRLRS